MTNTALLVIDVQRAAFDGVHCPPIDRSTTLVENALELVRAAHAGGVPVVFIQHGEGPGEPFEEDSPHWQLHEALRPQADDTVVRKRASSAFEGTDLAAVLEGFGAKALVLCGLQSEFCVSNTARSALAGGFEVVLAEDAHSTWPSKTESAIEISERVNHELEAGGARLSPTASLAHALRERRA